MNRMLDGQLIGLLFDDYLFVCFSYFQFVKLILPVKLLLLMIALLLSLYLWQTALTLSYRL